MRSRSVSLSLESHSAHAGPHIFYTSSDVRNINMLRRPRQRNACAGYAPGHNVRTLRTHTMFDVPATTMLRGLANDVRLSVIRLLHLLLAAAATH